ncbi:MAG TPA: hypothetical protein VJ946_08005 [Bacteroidales bacterium]|nr:hypothetical protein [Bacteroidales bacterium]
MPAFVTKFAEKANFHAKGRQVRQKLPVWVCITTGLRSETGLRDASLLSLLFPPLSGVTDILSLRDKGGRVVFAPVPLLSWFLQKRQKRMPKAICVVSIDTTGCTRGYSYLTLSGSHYSTVQGIAFRVSWI